AHQMLRAARQPATSPQTPKRLQHIPESSARKPVQHQVTRHPCQPIENLDQEKQTRPYPPLRRSPAPPKHQATPQPTRPSRPTTAHDQPPTPPPDTQKPTGQPTTTPHQQHPPPNMQPQIRPTAPLAYPTPQQTSPKPPTAPPVT